MTGDADLHQRSSSPLKRRASSMDPEHDTEMEETADSVQVEFGERPASVSTSSKNLLPRAMSVDLPDDAARGWRSADADANKTTEPPPLPEQIKTIQTLLQAFNEGIPRIGDVGYAVSKSWLEQALALGGDPNFAKKDLPEEGLGPLDNSDIIRDTLELEDGKFVRFRPGVSMEELEFFPEDAWTLVMEWYGLKQGQSPIVRRVINAAQDSSSPDHIVFEMNPPVFTVHRLWSAASGISADSKLKDAAPIVLVKSASAPYNEVFKELKTRTGIPMERKMRLHSILPPPAGTEAEPQAALTPPRSPEREHGTSPESWDNLLVDMDTFRKVDSSRRIKVEAPDHTNNANYNGKSPLSVFALTQDQILVLDEEVEKNNFVSTYFARRGNDRSIASRGVGYGLVGQSRGTNSGRNSPALSTRSGPTTRGRTQPKGAGRNSGAIGLHNLGNSCYMNSALQCVRNVEELTKYFLTNEYQGEINTDNPLGYDGQVALTYGSLLKEIFSGSKGAVSPSKFKNTIGRFRPTFAGWAQQDSQEFLGFLLDGLQEDLSRIKKKPYIEKPDSTDDMIGNDEAIREMAEKVWDITRRRDDSVIADLFTGMYKSTLKCPVCDKISITFDPFNNLTLPLPIEDLWSRSVKFYPLNDAPVEFELELPKHSALELAKKAIAERTGVPSERIFGAEEFKDKFFKLYNDNDDVSEAIESSDVAAFHELESLPTNWPRKPSPRSMLDVGDEEPYVDPRTERMVFPVFHRQRTEGHSSYGQSNITVPPHCIVLTREEAYNEDIIRRKILERVATFSTWPDFLDNNQTPDSDVVVTTQSDADSSGDGKVVASSVKGEDDLVEVSMKEENWKPTVHGVLKDFNKKRPEWIDPQRMLPPQLQNMFELSYFSDRSQAVPSGWTQFQDRQEYPKLSSRAPSDSSSDHDASGPSPLTNGGDSDAESASDKQSVTDAAAPTRMNDESSEEDEPSRPAKANTRAQRTHGRPGPGGRKKFKPYKTYGKKGAKRRNKEMRSGKEHVQPHDVPPQPVPQDDTPGPLIRLGEGIIVDWEESAWDAAFGKTDKADDDFRGAPTFQKLETVKDPALDQRRKKRNTRRNKGISLEECLDEFERAEILSEQDTWYCPRCKEHRRASKKFDLWKSPDILVVHLKRFSSAGYRREKLDVLVEFPIEGLDLTPRVLNKEDGKEEIYDLIAVDEHSGGLGGGHYTAVAKNFIDNKWYSFNDSMVSPCSPGKAVTKMAYLLFYRRRSSVPLGGPRFQRICDNFDNASEDDDDEDSDMAGLGEGRRLGDSSSPIGSSRLGNGAGATRRGANPGLARSTMSAQEDDDDELPEYEESSVNVAGGNTIHRSIEEDEGIDVEGHAAFQPVQDWNFNDINMTRRVTPELGSEGGFQTTESGSVDEDTSLRDAGSPFESGDYASEQPPPPLDESAQATLSDIQTEAWDRNNVRKRMIAVPAGGDDDDAASTEAAEIHLTDEDQQVSAQRPPQP